MATTHTVQANDGLDSLWSIAKHYGVSFQEIKQLNPGIMNRYPEGDPRHGWIFPGDKINLPPKRTSKGNLKTGVTSCPSSDKLEVIEIKGPQPYKLCEKAEFQVTKYKGSPTDADKQRIRWFVRDAATGEDLLKANSASIKEDGEKLTVSCVPFSWHDRKIEVGAQFDKPPAKAMYSGTNLKNELYDWIATIQKAETAYPGWSGVEMTDAMRRVASYGGPVGGGRFFQDLYGSPMPKTLTPSGSLTQADIDQLKTWTSHGSKGGTEVGTVEDPLGNKLAPGHVLTGISGGVYHQTDVDITPGGGIDPFGSKMDNLYAATISGDLGQVAVFVRNGTQKLPYLGFPGDASEAELIGDIDGFLIGQGEPVGGSGRKLSEILLNYYCPCSSPTINYKNAYTSFNSSGMTGLKDQVLRFAKNYSYLMDGKLGGMFTRLEVDCDASYDEFDKWLAAKMAKGR